MDGKGYTVEVLERAGAEVPTSGSPSVDWGKPTVVDTDESRLTADEESMVD